MRLLLIEDDMALGEGIHQALAREGYTVDWIRDGSSALHSLLSETFDLAVLGNMETPRLCVRVLHVARQHPCEGGMLALPMRSSY